MENDQKTALKRLKLGRAALITSDYESPSSHFPDTVLGAAGRAFKNIVGAVTFAFILLAAFFAVPWVKVYRRFATVALLLTAR